MIPADVAPAILDISLHHALSREAAKSSRSRVGRPGRVGVRTSIE